MKRAKPLARFYERETAAYAIVSGIDYILDECPFSAGARSLRLKGVLNSMENGSPGTKLSCASVLQGGGRKAASGCSSGLALGRSTNKQPYSGLCAFCRLAGKSDQGN